MTTLPKPPSASQPDNPQPNDCQDPISYELTNVHQIYDRIAPHFSRTRYKPWPVVESFLKRQGAGSIGIDVGCGNGKNLGVNGDLFLVGSDRYV